MGNGHMANTDDRDGAPWRMGTWMIEHMGDRTHGQWATWAMGHMGKEVSCLILKIEMEHLGGSGSGHMMNMYWIMCNFLNIAWIFTKILLHIDIDVFYLMCSDFSMMA